MYIQCIYKVRKSGEKTNRCQKINVENLFNIWLKTEINLINYFCIQTIDVYQSETLEGKKEKQT